MALSGIAGHAIAAGMDDPRRADYIKTFDGKTIAFVPSTMGIDLTEGWASALKQQANRLGMKLEIRDPHLSADVGAQAITALISEKPDVIIAHNLDVQSYASCWKRAEDAGIHVIQVSMRSNYNSDAYVGADWIAVGEAVGPGRTAGRFRTWRHQQASNNRFREQESGDRFRGRP